MSLQINLPIDIVSYYNSMMPSTQTGNKIKTIINDSAQQNLIDLLAFRNLVKAQLYLMSPVMVTKTLFDRVHQSMILNDPQNRVIGGICFYQITKHRCVSIIYFAVDSQYQAQGYGSYLMTNFKKQMRARGHNTIATQADTISLNFYYKNGFIDFPRKNCKLERQPRYQQISQEELNQEPKEKYRKYEPWLDYIQDYYSSVLLVYKISPKIDYDNFKNIVIQQRDGIIAKLDKKSYRQYTFNEEEMKKILAQKRQQYQKKHGKLEDQKRLKEEENNMLELKKQSNLPWISCVRAVTKLQQIALISILKKHPSVWILRMTFIKLQDQFHNSLSNLITIPFIQQNILNDKYSSVLELCADLTKMFENLKLFLAQGSHYYQACDQMEQYITPYIRQICQGTFNVIDYINKNKENNAT